MRPVHVDVLMTPVPASEEQKGRKSPKPPAMQNIIRVVLNTVIAALCVAAGYLSAEYVPLHRNEVPRDTSAVRNTARVLQCDVLNGCGAKGVSARVTGFLRSHGFDVVEMKNYKTFGVPHTIVVDRVGNLSAARRIAGALGVPAANIVQQLNPDYFVDVSVIIGADYSRLPLSQ
jgi:hypothetical protein